MTSRSKIKVLIHSNYSRLGTGFGKNMKNILISLYNDPDIELVEAANGAHQGTDMLTPWDCYGTYPSDPNLLKEVNGSEAKKRAAGYGFYTIDQIIEEVKPDVYLGIEDIWAFKQFEDKDWWDETKTIIWTTLDSLPILDSAKDIYSRCDKMLVWASFAEKAMKDLGCKNVETLHGAVDYENFFTLENKKDLRKRFNLDDSFVIGFVFKNQLRKSVPNLLEGFKRFKKSNKDSNAKLLLHTDWELGAGWDIPKYIKEKEINPDDVLATYVCNDCSSYFVHKYLGEGKKCPMCDSPKGLKTKNNSKGVSEKQLNEIYNLMDVYCHPFTSGGQELPVQEAKGAGLLTLVTNYSCGEDSCNEHQGGLPLDWSEYREPSTQFIKASTNAESICEQLSKVYLMDEQEKKAIVDNGKEYIKEKFCIKKTVAKLKEIIIQVDKQKKETVEKKETVDDKKNKMIKVTDLLDDEGSENRLLIVIPQSAGDILMVNGLIKNIKDVYPDKNIYVSTNMEFVSMLDDNPYIHKIIPYSERFENTFFLEGRGEEKGFFEIAFLPHTTTQKTGNYVHNGKDKIKFFK